MKKIIVTLELKVKEDIEVERIVCEPSDVVDGVIVGLGNEDGDIVFAQEKWWIADGKVIDIEEDR